ncbi:hypothetical protein [Klebsiella michiganensis]|uniref:hypothetical protein n=1 Tax=Klebsiella michiganensis TaxID=1134687 RepID=UPI0012B9DB7F|nr:hypothetical protein [Klebsiella michiganensis]
MRQVPFEVLMHAEDALAYSNQALAMLEIWMDSLGEGDEHKYNCVAAIFSLVHESKDRLQKAQEAYSEKRA